jgi:hypothetical protein
MAHARALVAFLPVRINDKILPVRLLPIFLPVRFSWIFLPVRLSWCLHQPERETGHGYVDQDQDVVVDAVGDSGAQPATRAPQPMPPPASSKDYSGQVAPCHGRPGNHGSSESHDLGNALHSAFRARGCPVLTRPQPPATFCHPSGGVKDRIHSPFMPSSRRGLESRGTGVPPVFGWTEIPHPPKHGRGPVFVVAVGK